VAGAELDKPSHASESWGKIKHCLAYGGLRVYSRARYDFLRAGRLISEDFWPVAPADFAFACTFDRGRLEHGINA
jgi:hypothetical protein